MKTSINDKYITIPNVSAKESSSMRATIAAIINKIIEKNINKIFEGEKRIYQIRNTAKNLTDDGIIIFR